MCEMCKRRDAVIEKVPTELKNFLKRGPVGNMKSPSPTKLQDIIAAGPGEQQDRLWRLAVRESKDSAERDLEFLLEKYSGELKAIEPEALQLLGDLIKDDLHKPHKKSDPELVN